MRRARVPRRLSQLNPELLSPDTAAAYSEKLGRLALTTAWGRRSEGTSLDAHRPSRRDLAGVRRRPEQRVPQAAPEPSAPQVRARIVGELAVREEGGVLPGQGAGPA